MLCSIAELAVFAFKVFFVAAVALASAATPALAFPFNNFHFLHDTTGYDVRVRSTRTVMHLTGTNPETGQTFKLRVPNSGRVSGEYEGQPVNYVLGKEAVMSSNLVAGAGR